MIQLPDDIRCAIEREEAHPTNIGSARLVLERALQTQLRNLATGLFAELLLRETQVPVELATQHMATAEIEEGLKAEEPKAFLQRLARETVTGAVKPVLIQDLPSVHVRILGGSACLWDDIEINNQLRDLGSDVRLAFPGADRLTFLTLRRSLDEIEDDCPLDARFILGRVGAKTAGPFGPVFDFRDELAVSPYVDPTTPGFSYENKAIVRHSVIRRLQHRDGRQSDDKAFGVRRLQVLIHELFHTAGYNHPSQMWYGTAFWLDDIESDICRFAQLPRAPREINEVFDMSIEQRILSEKAEALGLTGQELKLPDLSEVIDHLVGTEKLCVSGDGCYQSLVYKEGRRWVF